MGMTYNGTIEEPRGDYVNLEEGFDGGANGEASTSSGCAGGEGGWCWSLWWWLKLVLLATFLGVLAAVFCKWVGPFFMDKVIFLLGNTLNVDNFYGFLNLVFRFFLLERLNY